MAAKGTAALDRLRALCLAYPETRETSSWGHPNFKAGRKTFVAFEPIKGRPSIAFRLPPRDIERLLTRRGFFVTPYGRRQWVSLRVDANVDWTAVAALVDRSYRSVALKRMLGRLSSGRSLGRGRSAATPLAPGAQ